jgi:hypothetical protein
MEAYMEAYTEAYTEASTDSPSVVVVWEMVDT